MIFYCYFERARIHAIIFYTANPRLTLRSRLNCEIIRKSGNSQSEVGEKRLVSTNKKLFYNEY